MKNMNYDENVQLMIEDHYHLIGLQSRLWDQMTEEELEMMRRLIETTTPNPNTMCFVYLSSSNDEKKSTNDQLNNNTPNAHTQTTH